MNDDKLAGQQQKQLASILSIDPVGSTNAMDDPAIQGSSGNSSGLTSSVGGGRIGSIPIPKSSSQQFILGTSTAPGLNNFLSHHNPLQAPVTLFAPHSQIFNTTTTAAAAAAVNTTNISSFPNQAPHLQGGERKLNDRLLRSGKWVHEEEVYAALLIEAFESGVATDCANGSTLRSYLATKLQCAPMRISKKFAGKGIGKMVYLSKQNQHRHTSGMTEPDPDLDKKLREAEQKFHQAIFPMASNFLSRLPFANQGLLVPNLAVPLQGLMMPQIPLVLPNVGIPTAAAAALPPIPQPQDAAAEHAKQLKESYMRALQQLQQQPQQGPAPTGAEMPQHSFSNHGTQEASLLHIPEAPNFLLGFDQNMLLQSLLKPQLDLATMTKSSSHSPEVALETTPPKCCTDTDEVFVTSRSFDDFHRLLGKDVPMGVNGCGQLQEGTKNSDNMNGNALFTAESYALLAQESANEASQHAAYHRRPEVMLGTLPLSNTNSLDIDGVLKQIMSTAFASTNAEGDKNACDNDDDERPQGESEHAHDGSVNKHGVNHASMNGFGRSLKRKQHPTITMKPELTPVERFVGVTTNMVSSGSEPSGDSASSASGRAGYREGCGSDNNTASLDNSSQDSEDDASTSSGSSLDSDQEGPRRKKTKSDHSCSGSSIGSTAEENGEHPQRQYYHHQLHSRHHHHHHDGL